MNSNNTHVHEDYGTHSEKHLPTPLSSPTSPACRPPRPSLHIPPSVTESQLQEHNLGLPDSFLHPLTHWLLCAVGDQSGDENITQMLKRAHDCRKTAENATKALLMKLDGSCGGAFAVAGCSVQPWESLSSNSHTRYY